MTTAMDANLDEGSVLNSVRRLVRAINHFSSEIERGAGVTAAQLFVLQQLRDGNPIGPKELARRALTDIPAVMEVAEKLEQKNLVERRRSVKDLRVREIWLSAAGKILLRQSPDPIQSRLLWALKKLEPQSRAALGRILKQFLKEAGLEGERAALLNEEGFPPAQDKTETNRRSLTSFEQVPT
jgi:DNA-binding MarR family transcriptional regulator